MKVAVILPAAGLGTRMGKGTAEKAGTSRKQFMLLDGSPILMHTVRKFIASDRVGVIVIAVRAEDTEWVREMLAEEFESGRVRVVEGGNSRQESVEHALGSLGPEYELVAVHDAVRPFIDLETIHKVFDEAAETGAAICLFGLAMNGIPVSTTHTITGAIIGVGSTRRLSAVRWGITKQIVWAWLLTIPAAATVAALAYKILSTF